MKSYIFSFLVDRIEWSLRSDHPLPSGWILLPKRFPPVFLNAAKPIPGEFKLNT
jgi:hypothetical protein